ncbi:MAG: protein kinase [Proteobacteria bacterium]|nr:protein kinase [Pseudomonadota bacterium]
MTTAGSDIKRLGRYDITAVLGKGAMGVVYAGMDPRLHRKVAIKTILKSALDEDTAKEYTMRFDREAQAVARLNHPNIVQVYDFGAEGEVAYIVMEFIQGKELKDFFDANERFDIKEAVHIMCELCEALHFAHEAGIIHRDIKPANVMIDNKGRVKLADFGVARITDADRSASEKTQAGAIVGTPAYMSPEQIEGGEIDRRTDIFSAGIILYQFLTGEKPFTGTSTWTIAKKILQDEPVMPSKLNTNISPIFDAIIAKALAKNMNARYQTARDLGVDLKNALEGKAPGDDTEKTVVGSLRFDAAPLPPAAIAATPAGASGSHAGSTGTQEVELEFWRSIKDGNDADDFDLYVKQFPDGIYAALAKRKSAKLRGIASEETTSRGIAAAEQEKRELEEAARREAEVKAKLAEEKAKLEAELAKREADYQKRTAELEAKRAAEAKARAEAEAKEKAEFEAKLAKREADLQIQLKKQEEELKKNEEALKKKAAETDYLTKEIRKKKGSPLIPAGIGLGVVAVGLALWLFFKPAPPPETQELMAALEQAKKSNEQLIQARQAEQQAQKDLEEAKKREAEAKASGDIAKQQQLAEETRKREAELQKQAELVKQREAEAKAAVDQAQRKADAAKKAEEDRKAGKGKEDKAAADKAAADKAAADRAAADQQRAAAEKAAADKAAADKAAADKAEADRAAAAAAAKAAASPKAAAPAPEPAKPKITAAMGAAERMALRQDEAERKAAESRGATPDAKTGNTQLASAAPSSADTKASAAAPAAPTLSLYEQGKAMENSGNIKGAVRLYVRAVRAGQFEAARALGDIFSEGKGDVPKDYGESLRYYTLAEKNGVEVPRARAR